MVPEICCASTAISILPPARRRRRGSVNEIHGQLNLILITKLPPQFRSAVDVYRQTQVDLPLVHESSFTVNYILK